MRVFAIALCALMMGASATLAHEIRAGHLRISHPWCKMVQAAGGHLIASVKIANAGPEDDRLIGATLATAGAAEFKLGPVSGQSISVPAGASLVLRPSAAALVFKELSSQPVEGETIAGTLIFEKAGVVSVEFEIGG
jgi:copper(I)-binding protein